MSDEVPLNSRKQTSPIAVALKLFRAADALEQRALESGGRGRPAQAVTGERRCDPALSAGRHALDSTKSAMDIGAPRWACSVRLFCFVHITPFSSKRLVHMDPPLGRSPQQRVVANCQSRTLLHCGNISIISKLLLWVKSGRDALKFFDVRFTPESGHSPTR
jgi:hypothetical protein